MTYREFLEVLWDGPADLTCERLNAAEHTHSPLRMLFVVLSFMAWKLSEIERKTKDKEI